MFRRPKVLVTLGIWWSFLWLCWVAFGNQPSSFLQERQDCRSSWSQGIGRAFWLSLRLVDWERQGRIFVPSPMIDRLSLNDFLCFVRHSSGISVFCLVKHPNGIGRRSRDLVYFLCTDLWTDHIANESKFSFLLLPSGDEIEWRGFYFLDGVDFLIFPSIMVARKSMVHCC